MPRSCIQRTASPGIIGTKVKLRFDPFDISHIYVYVHNHWVECITSSFDRHIKVDVATAEHLVEKKRARGKTTTRYPDDPEMRDVYEEELRRLRLRAVLLAVCAARSQMGADACGCQKWGSRIPVC